MSDLDLLLKDERRSLEQELENVRTCISSAEARLAEIMQRLRHVNALLGGNELAAQNISSLSDARPSISRTETPSATDMAAKILSERQTEPMYYKDLAHEVIKRGGNLNGAEPGATQN